MHACRQVEDGVCVPGLTIKPVTCTADVEVVMRSAAAQQHAEASHLVLSVYVACKERATGGVLRGSGLPPGALGLVFLHGAARILISLRQAW